MTNKFLKSASILRNLGTSLAASISAAFFSNFLMFAWEINLQVHAVDFLQKWPNVIIMLLYPLLSLATGILIYYYYDNLDLFNKKEYYNSNSDSALIVRPQYLVSFAVSMLFSVLIFTNGYHVFLRYFFQTDIFVSRLLAVATMAILRLTQLFLLKNKWDNERNLPFLMEKSVFKRNSNPNKFKPSQMIWQPIGYTVVFWLCCWLCYEYLFALIPAFLVIVITLWYVILLLLLVPIIVGIVIRVIYNMKHRKVLLQQLKQLEQEGFASIKMKGHKWLSSTITTLPFELEIDTPSGAKYNGIVVTCGKINAPMFFKPDEYIVEHGFHLRGGALLSRGGAFGQVVDISNLGGNQNPTNMIFGYRMLHKLVFPEIEGQKIVILNPTPTSAYAVADSECKPIDTGEDMTNYTIYTATGLFNHIERQNRKSRFDD